MAKKLYIEPKVLVEKIVPEIEMITVSQETEDIRIIEDTEGEHPESHYIYDIDEVW